MDARLRISENLSEGRIKVGRIELESHESFNIFFKFCFIAETDRHSSYFSSYAKICRVVRWKYVGFSGKLMRN